MKKLLLFFIIPIIGCSPKQSATQEEILKEMLIEAIERDKEEYSMPGLKKKLPDSLLYHFPNEKEFSDLYYRFTMPNLNNILFVLYEDVEKNYLDSLQATYSSLSSGIYKASDSCLFVVNKYLDDNKISNNYTPQTKDLSILYNVNYLPVPNFWFLKFNSTTLSNLPEDFQIYVIKTGKGIFWEDLRPSPTMPKEWENGFSNGITISLERKVVIYWLLIW